MRELVCAIRFLSSGLAMRHIGLLIRQEQDQMPSRFQDAQPFSQDRCGINKVL